MFLGIRQRDRWIDEAIGLFEQVGQNFWLVRAYPHGVRTHMPLMGGRPESLEKVREYAAKAAKLLNAYGKKAEAAHFAQLAERLDAQKGMVDV